MTGLKKLSCLCPFFPFLSSSENIDKYNRVALFAGRRTIRIVNYHHFVFPLEVSRSGLKLFKPPQKRGEGCERLTVFMQSRVPLGPGKFHVVVLVYPKLVMTETGTIEQSLTRVF